MRAVVLMAVMLVAGTPPVDVRDISGIPLHPLVPSRRVNVLFFVMSDCPVSNASAVTVQRTCREYRSRGVDCSLIYEDVGIDPPAVRRHLADFGYDGAGVRAAIDEDARLAAHAGASVTPTAVVVDRRGVVAYRGRIDNLYVALGRTRQTVTAHDLRDALEATLADRPVQVPSTPAIGCHIVPADMRERLRSSGHRHE